MSLVVDNLKDAINGESNAKRKYELFSEQAAKENLNEIALLFKAASYAESLHIKNHLKALSGITKTTVNPEDFVRIDDNELKHHIKDTRSNLKQAIDGETYEFKKMYKQFVKNAQKEGDLVSELTFKLAREAEKVHARLYSNYLKKLQKNKEIEPVEIYVCTICGNIEFAPLPEICPVCDHDKKFFKKM